MHHLPKYDVIIVGAGPAGCATALTLKDSGLRMLMLERDKFPRDKVCGDAIPARAIKTLKAIEPALAESFKNFPQKLLTKKTDVIYNDKVLDLYWQIDAYTCKRVDFDDLLVDAVRANTNTTIVENAKVGKITVTDSGVRVEDKSTGTLYHADVVVGADGANSTVSKQLTGRGIDRKHHIGAVRAYYKGVEGLSTDKIEMYLHKDFLPGYLWIFPVSHAEANVGFGMISRDIAKNNVNIKKAFNDFIHNVPELQQKFKHAAPVGKLEGHNLPLGSRGAVLSGDRFLLSGDAGSLIDPISGEGIGNAMWSGKLAAEQIIRSFDNKDFSAAYLSRYDKEVYKGELGTEIKMRYRAQRIIHSMPFLIDVAFFASKNKRIRKYMQDRF